MDCHRNSDSNEDRTDSHYSTDHPPEFKGELKFENRNSCIIL